MAVASVAPLNKIQSRRLLYLDGLRGLAALYVVMHHAYMEVASERIPARMSFLVRHLTNWLAYGQVGVDVFIVLSGYCLMLPVTQSGGSLRGGALQYLRRRARRILPPYYVALALSLLLIAATPGLNRVQGYRWDTALPALRWDAVLSHLLLLHDFNGAWVHSIDPPMWSVAVEWQIYFLFPLLLLPLWRRFGSGVTVGIAFAAGLFPHFALDAGDFACPWFLGLFALGMAAASLNVQSKLPAKRLLKHSGGVCLLAVLVFLVASMTAADWLRQHLYAMDALVGLAAACFLAFCTQSCYDAQTPHPFALRLVETPFAVFLGSFSYSLYLVHFPLLSLLHLWLRPLHLSASGTLAILLGTGVPVSLLFSYGFHLLFERRFMPGSPKRIAQAEEAAVISPAP